MSLVIWKLLTYSLSQKYSLQDIAFDDLHHSLFLDALLPRRPWSNQLALVLAVHYIDIVLYDLVLQPWIVPYQESVAGVPLSLIQYRGSLTINN